MREKGVICDYVFIEKERVEREMEKKKGSINSNKRCSETLLLSSRMQIVTPLPMGAGHVAAIGAKIYTKPAHHFA